MDASIFGCISGDEKYILKISDTLDDSTVYETKLLRTKMELLEFESRIAEVDDIYKNDVEYEAHLLKFINWYKDDLKEFKKIWTKLESFDIENKVYVAQFKDSFENFRANMPKNDKKLKAKLNELENACSERLLIAQNERTLIIKILQKMEIDLGSRNTCLKYLTGISGDRREIKLFIAGIDHRREEDINKFDKFLKMINNNTIKVTNQQMIEEYNRWPKDIKSILGKNAKLATRDA